MERGAIFPASVVDGRFTRLLDGGGQDAARVGSKAASLDRLIAARFPVPAAVAVTTDAYHLFVRESGLDGLVAEMRSRPLPKPSEMADTYAEIEAAFLGAPMPAALSALIARVTDHLGRGAVLAVRSSATAEDLEGASFAGQYLSVIGVEGAAETERAVKRVWASLWHPAAESYRRQLEIPDLELGMAVILQQLIPAELSGVVFTSDPTHPHLIRVEAVRGFGEELVSGRATPMVHLLRRPGLQPVGADTVDRVIREAAHTALRVEEQFDDVRQDVEWSAVEGRVWVLQARPITTIDLIARGTGDGFDTPPIADSKLLADPVAEMLPGVLSPLMWTMNAPMVENSFRYLFHRLGALPVEARRTYMFLARRRGRAYLDLGTLERVAARIPGWSAADLQGLYTNIAPDAQPPQKRRGSLLSNLRAYRVRNDAADQASSFVRTVGAVLQDPIDVSRLLDAELVAYRARLRDLAAPGVRAEMMVAAAAVAAYRALEETLRKWLGDDASVWTQRLTRTAGVTDGPMERAGRVLAQCPEQHVDGIRSVLRDGGDDVVIRLKELGPVGLGFVTALRNELERAGSAAMYAGPTWLEHEQRVFAALAVHVDPVSAPDVADELEALEQTLTSLPRWRTTRIVTGQVIDLRLRMVRNMVDDAVRLLALRERSKASLLALGGRERAVIGEIGRRFAQRGWLEHGEHIELYADWEVEDALLERNPLPSTEVLRRLMILEQMRSERAGPRYVEMSSDEAIKGWAASPGRHTGPVRVVHDPAQADDMEPGSVLVAPATDPSWVPLMQRAGAMIIERGGPLSHAAIVAREFGVPAVLNIAAATALFVDGMVVEVDGTEGTVRVVREVTG